jgi:hypothetical protein
MALKQHDNIWECVKPGWHEVVLYAEEPGEDVFLRYQAAVKWITDNVQGHHKHCIWMYDDYYLKCKFRYERDYLWFKLTWG